jgi:wyosine [tRNA(Phe)-imidazoG37] synthetase (radical SAM superfamily)
MDDNDSELSYVSSVDPFQPETEKPSIDAPDEKALVRINRALEGQIALYHTISGMKQFNTAKFNAEQREALCDQYVQLLASLQQLINNAIDGIKEKQLYGRRK